MSNIPFLPNPNQRDPTPPWAMQSFGMPNVRPDPALRSGSSGFPNIPMRIHPDPVFAAMQPMSHRVTEPEVVGIVIISLKAPVSHSLPVEQFLCPLAPLFVSPLDSYKHLSNATHIKRGLSLAAFNYHCLTYEGRRTLGRLHSAQDLFDKWSLLGIQRADEKINLKECRGSAPVTYLAEGPLEVPNIWLSCEQPPVPGATLWLVWRRVRYEESKHVAAERAIGLSLFQADDDDENNSKADLWNDAPDDDTKESDRHDDDMPDDSAEYKWEVVPYVTYKKCVPSGLYNNMSHGSDRYAGYAKRIGTARAMDSPVKMADEFPRLQAKARHAVFPIEYDETTQGRLLDLPKIKVDFKI